MIMITSGFLHGLTELIDTQWDVNTGEAVYTLQNSIELIDTQWDVNAAIRRATSFDDQELIDTQWDVNLSHAQNQF